MMFEVVSSEIREKRKHDLESALLLSQDIDLVCNIHENATKAFLWSQGMGLWLFISQYCYWPHVVYEVQCWLIKTITILPAQPFLERELYIPVFFNQVLTTFCPSSFLFFSTFKYSWTVLCKMLSTDGLKTDWSQNILWRLSHLMRYPVLFKMQQFPSAFMLLF